MTFYVGGSELRRFGSEWLSSLLYSLLLYPVTLLHKRSAGFSASFLTVFRSLKHLSLRADFICVMANSKLCFLLHETSSAAKNACPSGGRNLRSRLLITNHSSDDF